MAGVASAASAFLIDFVARRWPSAWTLAAPGPLALCLGAVLGVTLTWLYIRHFEPLDPTLTRRLAIYGVVTATTTLVVSRLVLRLPYSTDSLALLMGLLLGVTLTWVHARYFENP